MAIEVRPPGHMIVVVREPNAEGKCNCMCDRHQLIYIIGDDMDNEFLAGYFGR